MSTQSKLPSQVHGEIGFFDRFAARGSAVVSRAPFFAFCILLIIVWLLEGVVRAVVQRSLGAFVQGTYQLQINTTTTIITFLLVALLQNSQTRAEHAMQQKLNAIADGLADLMTHVADRTDDEDLREDIQELKLSVGLEEREGTGRKQNGAEPVGTD